jgi:hypothetical protein
LPDTLFFSLPACQATASHVYCWIGLLLVRPAAIQGRSQADCFAGPLFGRRTACQAHFCSVTQLIRLTTACQAHYLSDLLLVRPRRGQAILSSLRLSSTLLVGPTAIMLIVWKVHCSSGLQVVRSTSYQAYCLSGP